MNIESQRIIVQIDKRNMNFTHLDALKIVHSMENFIPDKPVRSIGGYGSYTFVGDAVGDIRLPKGVRIYDNEDLDLTDPNNFARLVQEELTTRKSGLRLTDKSREDRDDQFFFEKIAQLKAQAIQDGDDHVFLASIGTWDIIYKFYAHKATWLERLLMRFSEKHRVRFIAKYGLTDWQRFLVRYFKKAGENPVPEYCETSFNADYGGQERPIVVIGYALVLQL